MINVINIVIPTLFSSLVTLWQGELLWSHFVRRACVHSSVRKQILQTTSPPTPQTLQERSLVDPPFKVVQMVPVHCISRSQELKWIFKLKTSKIFLSETTRPISIYHGRNVPFVTPYQDCSNRYDLSKTHGRQLGAGGSGGTGLIFSIYNLYRKPAEWLSGRASALWPVGCGFDPRPGHTKYFKNGTSCSFAWRSALRM